MIALLAAPALRAATVDGTLFELVGATGNTVDRIPFSLDAAGDVTIDVRSWEFTDFAGPATDLNADAEFAFFDPHIYLFVDDGSLDAGDVVPLSADPNPGAPGVDDLPPLSPVSAADGSVSRADPFVTIALPAGDYVLVIGAAPGFMLADAIAGFDPDGGKLYAISPVTGSPDPGHDHGDYRITFSDNVDLRSQVAVPEPAASLTAMGALALCLLPRRPRCHA